LELREILSALLLAGIALFPVALLAQAFLFPAALAFREDPAGGLG